MKTLDKKQVILIKKIVSFACIALTMLLFLIGTFNYVSTTAIMSGSNVTMQDSFSLYQFLFDSKQNILDSRVDLLRNVFSFSHILMWISFVLNIIALVGYGIAFFIKNVKLMKIFSITNVVAVCSLCIVNFDVYSAGNTRKYFNSFSIAYFIIILIGSLGLISILNLREKQ